MLCAFLIGLGYGPSAPAGSDLLMKVVPRHRRATIFSIKQAGVPLGGLAAGLLLPLVAVLTGSVLAGLATASVLAILAAVVLGRFRGLDAEAPAARAPTPWRSLLVAPLRLFALVLGRPALAGMTAAGFALGIAQGILMGYYPVILSDHAGWSIVSAGLAFAVLQGVGVPGRVLMGWVSDRMGAPVRALSLLCLVSGATMIALAAIGPNSGTVWVIALSALAGLTVVSWNGVFLSGLAEAAPEGRVGEITAAGTFVLFSGYVVAPLAIQQVFAASDGYAGGLVLAGIIPILAGLALLAGPARRPAPRP